MAITIKNTVGDLSALEVSNRAIMREIGLFAREQIIRRTLAGRDEHDAAFRPYSEGYRQRKGRELGGGGHVNLQVSGAMLNAITLTEVTETSVTLGFSR